MECLSIFDRLWMDLGSIFGRFFIVFGSMFYGFLDFGTFLGHMELENDPAACGFILF